MQNTKIQRFEYLDGLRGLAALIVVVNHFNNAFFDELNTSPLLRTISEAFKLQIFTGHFCVQLFFVLSGFVLAYNSFNRTDFLQKQWTKRAVRLALPVLLTSIIYFIFSKFNMFYFRDLITIYHSDWAAGHWNIKYTYIQFIVKCLYDFMLFADWNFGMNINSSLWTIPIELYWSYILFVLFFVLSKVKSIVLKNIVFIIFAFILFFFYKFIGAEYAFLFLGGSLIALNNEFIKQSSSSKLINVLLTIVVMIITYSFERNWLPQNEIFSIKLESVLAIMYLIVAIRIEIIQKIFSISVMKWLGRISFPLYLLHILVIGSISSKLYILFPYFRADTGLIFLLAITLAFSMGISHIYTVYVDEPLMKLYDKFYKMLVSKLKTDEII